MRASRFIFVCLLLLLYACGPNDIEQVKKVAQDQTLPIETGKNVEINYTDSGFTRAKVNAPLLERYATEDKNYTEMRSGINVKFLDKNGNVESFLTAKYAVRYDREKKMMARNDVVVRNVDGDTLRTEELFWDETTQKVYSEKFVQITTKDEILKGMGFESDVSFKHPKIFKLTGTVNLK